MGHDPPLIIFKKRRMIGKLGQIANQVIQKAWPHRLVGMTAGDQAHQQFSVSETIGAEGPALACVSDDFPFRARGCRDRHNFLKEFLHDLKKDMLVSVL